MNRGKTRSFSPDLASVWRETPLFIHNLGLPETGLGDRNFKFLSISPGHVFYELKIGLVLASNGRIDGIEGEKSGWFFTEYQPKPTSYSTAPAEYSFDRVVLAFLL